MIPRIVVAGTTSNAGKTTVAAGLIAALRQRGLVVQPFKCGPDYVDPSYHERAAGRPCRNLDTWMLGDSQLVESFDRACRGADIAVVEGVMGIYDGSDWHDERGSTAQIAKLLNAPVLLVLDISGAARSAAAIVLGYQAFDRAVQFAGVVLNFAGSEGHARGCAEAIARTTGMPMLGWLPRDLRLRIPERHLGLVPRGEQLDSDALIAEIATAVRERFDVERVAAIAGSVSVASTRDEAQAAQTTAFREPGPILAVARDEAFCFYYPENLELLADAGATIAFFSPVHGERIPANAAGVYLGGGYPELHGAALGANTTLWSQLRELHAADVPIYAECGGFMVLTEALVDSDGQRWPMAGLLPGVAQMTGKLAALGYRHATALRGNLLSEEGESLRGHEFRYSSWVRHGNGARNADGDLEVASAAWRITGSHADGPVESVGYARGNLLASYLHVHFGQSRRLAERFVQRMLRQ